MLEMLLNVFREFQKEGLKVKKVTLPFRGWHRFIHELNERWPNGPTNQRYYEAVVVYGVEVRPSVDVNELLVELHP